MILFVLVSFFIFRKSRTTFDTSDTRRAYGPVIIDYAKVQAKVTLKYDSWHKEALGKFGTFLGTEMGTFHTKVSKSRNDLEMQSIGEFLAYFERVICGRSQNAFILLRKWWNSKIAIQKYVSNPISTKK